jgi:hypothetical protein
MSYIGANEMVFNNDTVNGIHTGGFSVNSIMMKNGISPIMTINKEQSGGSNLVSDIFNNLVVPNWTLSYDNKIGGKYKDIDIDIDSDEDEVIDEDLHDKLLELVKENDSKIKEKKKRATRRQTKAKKGGSTKRNK